MQIKPIRIKKTTAAFLLCAAVLLLLFGTRMIHSSLLGYGGAYYLSLIILQLIVYVLPAIFYTKLCGGESTLRVTPIALPRLGFVLSSALTLLFGSAALKIMLAYMGATSGDFAGYESSIALTDSTGVSDVIYIIMAFVICPALCQELVFRGILLQELRGTGGSVCAVLLCGAMYAFTFFTPETFLYHFAVGSWYGVVSLLSRSLLSAVLLHGVYSLFYVFAESYLLHLAIDSQYLTLVVFIIVSLALFSLAITLGEAERLCYNDGIAGVKSPDTPRYDPDGDIREQRLERFRTHVLSPGFLLCAALFIAGSLMTHLLL